MSAEEMGRKAIAWNVTRGESVGDLTNITLLSPEAASIFQYKKVWQC
jgi:hypothetical protein